MKRLIRAFFGFIGGVIGFVFGLIGAVLGLLFGLAGILVAIPILILLLVVSLLFGLGGGLIGILTAIFFGIIGLFFVLCLGVAVGGHLLYRLARSRGRRSCSINRPDQLNRHGGGQKQG